MSSLKSILEKNQDSVLADWLAHQTKLSGNSSDLMKEADRVGQSRRVLESIGAAAATNSADIHSTEWRPALQTLEEISKARAHAGFTVSQTATYIFSLKQALFAHLQREFASNPKQLAEELWAATEMVDALGLHTVEAFQKSREEVIKRQQMDMLELSTPVIRLFQELIALPLIGTLDSARTQVVMENLLNSIVTHGASIAILDITGVPTVDTQVAQHLLKTVAAARLMGTDCIISGVRPQIAQTIVHLGVDLHNVTTKATMADALQIALHRLNYSLVRAGSAKA